ncbi:metallophosphoesterase [Neptuniibacter sp. QD37_6]|uniref:metallophosphoesterase n=1 Tax=Neptuniibacter sp. QD37_6 TaxID=3398210 RepID=UPI0039F62BC4
MKLLLLSDIHLEVIADADGLQIPETSADIILFLGDIASGEQGLIWAIEQCERLGIKGLYIPGNHEYYGCDIKSLDNSLRAVAKGSAVTFLNCDEYIHNDFRFLGCTLWSDFEAYGAQQSNLAIVKSRIKDYRKIEYLSADNGAKRRFFLPEDALAMHQEHRGWLEEKLAEPFNGKTILLSHHGISKQCQHPQFPIDELAGSYWSDLEYLFKDHIELACFGHTHANLDLRSGAGFRLVSNQMGYRRRLSDLPECPDFSFQKIIEI